jgi:hypothetical protein
VRPVGLGEKNILAAVAPQDYMVDGARVVNSRFSNHIFIYQAKDNMSSLTPFSFKT